MDSENLWITLLKDCPDAGGILANQGFEQNAHEKGKI
jgi:hypothetical protein